MKYEFDITPFIPPADAIPYKPACDAYALISFDPEKRGAMKQREFVEYIHTALKEIAKGVLEEAQGKIATELIPNFIATAKSKYMAYLAAKSRTASPMITGPARFPVDRNRKAMETEHKRSTEFVDFVNNGVRRMLKAIKGVQSDEGRIEERWLRMEAAIRSNAEAIVGIDNKTQHYSRNLFVKSTFSFIERAALDGYPELVKRSHELLRELQEEMVKPIFTDNHSVWGLIPIAEAAEFVRKETQKLTGTTEAILVIAKYEDGTYIQDNKELERVQIMFPDRPSPTIIESLKRNAFKWSPSNKAWQRQNTANGIAAAKNLISIFTKEVTNESVKEEQPA